MIDSIPLFLDYIAFEEHLTNISYGRRPDGSGNWVFLDPPTPRATNGEEPQNGNIPDNYLLYQNFPNPFNNSTKIRYGLPEDTKVKIVMYDVLGCQVATLINEEGRKPAYTKLNSLPQAD